jgi:hypothetical protein
VHQLQPMTEQISWPFIFIAFVLPHSHLFAASLPTTTTTPTQQKAKTVSIVNDVSANR